MTHSPAHPLAGNTYLQANMHGLLLGKHSVLTCVYVQMDNVTKELKTNNMKLKGLVTSVSSREMVLTIVSCNFNMFVRITSSG